MWSLSFLATSCSGKRENEKSIARMRQPWKLRKYFLRILSIDLTSWLTVLYGRNIDLGSKRGEFQALIIAYCMCSFVPVTFTLLGLNFTYPEKWDGCIRSSTRPYLALRLYDIPFREKKIKENGNIYERLSNSFTPFFKNKFLVTKTISEMWPV